MVFGVYFHFVVLCDEYHIFTNIFWNFNINKKCNLFWKISYLGVELLYYGYILWKEI